MFCVCLRVCCIIPVVVFICIYTVFAIVVVSDVVKFSFRSLSGKLLLCAWFNKGYTVVGFCVLLLSFIQASKFVSIAQASVNEKIV